MKLARLAAAAAIPFLSIVGFAGSASAAASITITPAGPIPTTGATVTVDATGFPALESQLNISQCVAPARYAGAFNPNTDCEIGTNQDMFGGTDGAGVAQDTYPVKSGVVLATTAGGQGFLCDATHACQLRVTVGPFPSVATQAFIPLSFAAGTAVTTTTTIVDPNPVVPESPLPIMLPIGAAAVLGAGYMMLRKGRNSNLNA
jgi:hypothetical protein